MSPKPIVVVGSMAFDDLEFPRPVPDPAAPGTLRTSFRDVIGGSATYASLAASCFALSHAQRTLSTPVRALRRRTRRVEGSIERTDGTVEPLDASALRSAPESALRWLSLALPLLAAGAVAAKLT